MARDGGTRAAVEVATADLVDFGDPVFDAARAAYPDFGAWSAKARAQRRPCHVVRDGDGLLAAAVLKVDGQGVKLCSMAVRADARGRGIGAAVIRGVAEAFPHAAIRVRVLRHKADAVGFLLAQGFRNEGVDRGDEVTLVMGPNTGSYGTWPPLPRPERS